MKAGNVSVCLAFSLAANVFGDGDIIVANRHLLAESGDLYHVPIWIDINADGTFTPGEGLGSYAAALGQKASFALYLQGNSNPVATATFRTDINGAFLGTPASQTARLSGFFAGQTAPLTVKVWVGAVYETAVIRGSWDFISQPLGGAPVNPNDFPIIPPTLGNWGPADGTGYALLAPTGPIAGADTIVRTTLGDGSASIESFLANDADPNGPVTLVAVDALSNGGSVVSLTNGRVVYHAGRREPDYFFYTVRNNAGGLSRGRVNVVIDDPKGMIEFANQNIPMSNGGGFYNSQIYVDANGDNVFNAGEAFGSFAALYYDDAAKLGLFLKGSETPLAVSKFHINALASLLGDPATQTVVIPGAAPGAEVELTVKAWIGESFEASRIKGAWDFKSRPLGGVTSAQAFPIPGMTGWGPESGAGLGLSVGTLPVAGTDELVRDYRQGVVATTVEALLANDSDPEGGSLIFVGVDLLSSDGGSVTVSGSKIFYQARDFVADHFFYTIRNARGAVAKGRVNIKLGEPIGEIRIRSREILKLSGEGYYDVPIWIDVNTNGVRDSLEGIGDYAARFFKSAQFGVYVQGEAEPFITGDFARGGSGAFFVEVADGVLVPGFKPGERAPLTIKAWLGSDFATAKIKGSWDFTSAPLGGPTSDGTMVSAPSFTGWGDESGSGYALEGDTNIILQPIFIPIVIGQPVDIPISIFLPVHFTNTIIYFGEATAGGAGVITFHSSVSIDAVLFSNDSFAYTLVTPEGLGTGVASLEVRESPAKMFFSNRLVRRSDGAGAYNVPVWVDENFNGRRDSGEGIGSFAAKMFGSDAKLGLFSADGATPIATARFNRDRLGAFLEEPDFQEVTIPNVSPGTQAPLLVKAWVGESFDGATIKGSWNFTSQRLGGGAHTGIFEIPDVTGWGNETNNAGYAIIPGAKPKTYGHVVTRTFGQNANVKLADIFKNDSDPDGGALTLASVNEVSREGGVVTLLGDTAYYIPAIQETKAPDYFEYTVRNSKGGIAKGRVDVVVTDANGEFHTLLAIGHTPDGIEVSFRGIAGANYLVQARTAVDAEWQDLGLAIHQGFGLFKITDANATNNCFYRVLTQRP